MARKTIAQHGLEKQHARLVGELEGVKSVLLTAREAAASIPNLEAKKTSLEDSTLAVEKSIKLFDPEWSAAGRKSTKPSKRRNPLPWNAPARHAMAMLHTKAEGFTTGEMIVDLCRIYKLGPIPDGVRESFRAAIDLSMKRKERDGYVVGEGMRPRKWKLAPRPAQKPAV